MIHTGDVLKDIIATSKNHVVTETHTYTGDMNVIGALLSDNVERYGVNAVQGYVDGYLRGLKLTWEASEDYANRLAEAKDMAQEFADDGDEPDDFSDERRAQDEN